ncbi:hypothetical protein BGZ70_001577 [Mortierella alpina]|uniref:Uncharacterized protein n=1 Tax=Mortierella alpina TaxID=64518 RepID=A0A9P6LWV0_MORAP|nr:hypothetical protein BGZ70_001577 [Mortierella alpina]
MVQFRLFDKVKVALRLKKSLAHRHSIYMTLIGLQQDASSRSTAPVAPPLSGRLLKRDELTFQKKNDMIKHIAEQDPALLPLSELELIQGIQEGEQDTKASKKKTTRKKPMTEEESYQQTRPDASLYNLIESFERCRIIESQQP